ncbi:MAG: RIP metalloprotease RseP [Desulfotomaculaceae bacterium]|nr:RIP metalloprotease RseP [Desulfotomaculaceae bacterium]
MLTFVASIFVFGLLVLIHELGHFIVAKMVGIKVMEFSLGFGPKVAGVTGEETQYNLRLLPLGGFVRMAGMESDGETDEEDELRGFNKKTISQRIAVIFAGPFMNFLLAALLFALVFAFQGIPVATTVISETPPDYPAFQAGLRPGDQILAINGERIENWDQLVLLIDERPEQNISVSVLRNGAEQQFNIHTVIDESGTGKIGIVPEQSTRKLGLIESLGQGLVWTGRVTLMILDFLSQMIFGQAPADFGGPVRVVSEIGKAASVGFFFLLQLAAFLSINLGLFNLFPIPALDGSRILFLFWEKLRGRPVDPVKENFIHLVGLGLLLLLMVVITYNDILSIFVSKNVPGQ